MYEDDQRINLTGAYPGAYAEKEIRVTNTGTVAVTYAMGFIDMLNEFINDELVISYTCTSYANYGTEEQEVSGTCLGLAEQVIENDDPLIEEGITIGAGITQVYNLKVEFKETGSNQNYNQGVSFSGVINIAESADAFTLFVQVLDEDGDAMAGVLGEVHSRVRTGISDENGIMRIPMVTQGEHTLIIKNPETNEEIMSAIITVEVAPTASVSGSTIKGQKGTEEVPIQIQKKANDTVEISLLEMSYLEVDLVGGETSQQFMPTYTPGEEITLIEPEKENYIFDGWEVSGTSVLTGNTLKFGVDITKITATWTPAVYNITYDYGGGSGNNPATYNVESSAITLSAPNARAGYTFMGWTGSNGTTPQTTITIPSGSTGDKSYTANWRYYLFNSGDVAMGGFTELGSNSRMSWSATLTGARIRWNSSGAGWGENRKIVSKRLINMTGFTKFVVHFVSYSGSSEGGQFYPYVGMCKDNTDPLVRINTGIGAYLTTVNWTNHTLIDTFSNVTNSYYFCTGYSVNNLGDGYSYSMSVNIDKVWLE